MDHGAEGPHPSIYKVGEHLCARRASRKGVVAGCHTPAAPVPRVGGAHAKCSRGLNDSHYRNGCVAISRIRHFCTLLLILSRPTSGSMSNHFRERLGLLKETELAALSSGQWRSEGEEGWIDDRNRFRALLFTCLHFGVSLTRFLAPTIM